jgi:putative serine protease PepD
VEPGEGVVAIGSPFGYSDSITAGIVSAFDRTIQAPNGFSISDTIQTDAAINHGNSGGPLIAAAGEVIGVTVQIATGDSASSQNAGVGFAVASDTVKTVLAEIVAGREVAHAYLGVSVGEDATRAGALIGAVRVGSPAATAGLRAGDLVTAVDGEKLLDAGDLTAAVNAHRPGDTITLVVSRDGASRTVTVVLGSRPATSS